MTAQPDSDDEGAGIVGDAEFDSAKPCPARIYDLFLAGKSGFAADREEAARVEAAFSPPLPGHLPAPREMALRSRLFADRAVSWASRHGVRQVLDLGAGYPAGGRIVPLPGGGTVTLRDIHEAAGDGGPARVVYADKDPVAVSHMSALAADGKNITAILGDVADPDAILADPAVRDCIDFRLPVCVVLSLVLQQFPAGTARQITAAWVAAASCPGSVLAISSPRISETLWGRAGGAYTAGVFFNHAPADVVSFFAGTEIMAPGVVPARGWNAGWADCAKPDGPAYVLAGVGRVRS